MRIISKERDYYDSVQRHGSDPKAVYIRKPIDLPFLRDASKKQRPLRYPPHVERFENKYGHILYTHGEYGTIKTATYYIRFYMVSFCNKLYPVVGVKKDTITKYFHTEDKTIEYLLKIGYIKSKRAGRYEYWWSVKTNIHSLFNYTGQVGFEDLHLKYKSPVILVDFEKRCTIINANLKRMNFMKCIDPYTAYQEIEQYLFGVIGNCTPPMIEIDDKCMAAKKGFGHKYAFRKEPERKGS